YELLAQRFRPIFARIAEGAVERERQRALPHEAIAWLKQAGFGAVLARHAHGASLPQLVQLLIELAEADSNITQALRG
ncbi:monooxygenase, partial [Listeria monocytogenes]|nr:monooxygenase [Listeria monocytogenes]